MFLSLTHRDMPHARHRSNYRHQDPAVTRWLFGMSRFVSADKEAKVPKQPSNAEKETTNGWRSPYGTPEKVARRQGAYE